MQTGGIRVDDVVGCAELGSDSSQGIVFRRLCCLYPELFEICNREAECLHLSKSVRKVCYKVCMHVGGRLNFAASKSCGGEENGQ